MKLKESYLSKMAVVNAEAGGEIEGMEVYMEFDCGVRLVMPLTSDLFHKAIDFLEEVCEVQVCILSGEDRLESNARERTERTVKGIKWKTKKYNR